MIEKFLDYLQWELNRAQLTVDAYHTDLTQFSEWLNPNKSEEFQEGKFRQIDYTSVTSSDIRTWLSSLARKGESPRTIRRKTIALRSFYKWMLKNGYVKTSPLRDVPLPKISKPLPDIVKSKDIEEALNPGNTTVLYGELIDNLVVEMLYSLGIRRAELIGIDDTDISLHKYELKVTGKRAKQRIVPIPEALMHKIQQWQDYRDKNLVLPTDEKPLLVVKGKRITASQIYRIVQRALAHSTAKKKSPHALRHSFASDMLNGGAEIDTVREFLGHNSLATTQIYTHISFQEIKKAYSSAHPRSAKSEK